MIDFECPPEVARVAAIFSGAAVSVALSWRENWPRRLTMALVCLPIAWYSGPELVKFVPKLSPGFISFVLGVFGAKIAGNLYDAISAFPLAALLAERVRSTLGLPPKPPQNQG